MLALDLGVFHRKSHEIKIKELSHQVPTQYLHRVLFWGVFGALSMRAILVFVGMKMLISDFCKFDPFVSLGIITLILGASVEASFIWKKKLSKT